MVRDSNGDVIAVGDLVKFVRSSFEIPPLPAVGIVLEVQDDHPIKFVRILANGEDDWYRVPHEIRRIVG